MYPVYLLKKEEPGQGTGEKTVVSLAFQRPPQVRAVGWWLSHMLGAETSIWNTDPGKKAGFE